MLPVYVRLIIALCVHNYYLIFITERSGEAITLSGLNVLRLAVIDKPHTILCVSRCIYIFYLEMSSSKRLACEYIRSMFSFVLNIDEFRSS